MRQVCMCVLLLASLALLDIGQVSGHKEKPPCEVGGLARYNVKFTGLWSKEDFPKQYPLFRPPAQWSKMIGRGHSEYYTLWRLGEKASAGVKKFVEIGGSAILDKETQGRKGIIDDFSLAAIPDGTGQVSATFYLDAYHPKVSLIAKIVPSPDWFVGIDSLDLCEGGKWVKEASVDLHPLDAGTDQGFTFTAPNWASIPFDPITKITSQRPNHPANSFYYPERDENPPLGRLEFQIMTTYDIKSGEDGHKEFMDEIKAARAKAALKPTPEEEDSGEAEVQNKVDIGDGDLGDLLKGYRSTKSRTNLFRPFFGSVANVKQTTSKLPVGRKEGVRVSMRSSMTDNQLADTQPEPQPTGHNKKNHRIRSRKNKQKAKQVKAVHCEVTEWTDWQPCTKTCGFGIRYRSRDVTTKPANQGRPCPNLREEEICGSMRNCQWSHFRTFGRPRN